MISNPFAQLPDNGNESLSFLVDSVAESLPHNVVPPAHSSLDATDAAIRHPAAAHAELQPEPEPPFETSTPEQARRFPYHPPQMMQLYDAQPMQQAEASPSHQGIFRADSLLWLLCDIHQPSAQPTDHTGHDRSYQRNPPISEIPGSHCLSVTRACPGTAHFKRGNERVADKSSGSIARQYGYLVEEDVSPTTPRPPQRPHCENIVELVIDRATQLPLHSDNRLLSPTPRPEEISTPCANKACSDNRISQPPPAVPQPQLEPTMLSLFMHPTRPPLERHAMIGDYHLGSFLAGGDQRFPSQVSTLAAHGLPRVG